MSRARAATDRLDDAARAGWLYYIAGRTQDEVAAQMGISRQAAQRLVSLAVEARLVKVWMDHPIARCLELGARLRERYGLRGAEVVPTDPDDAAGLAGIGEAGAAEMMRWLGRPDPLVVGIGSGRTLKSVVEHLPPISCPQHRVVSLTGSIGPDGSAAYYNVVFSMAEAVTARRFPLPLPVFLASEEERAVMHGLALIRSTLELAAAADVAFIGVGEMDDAAPLFVDGFLGREDLYALKAAGAEGEICGWAFDGEGRLLTDGVNRRVASAPIPPRDRATVFAIAKGPRKIAPLRAALRGGLANAVVTDEATAEALLA
ncbi:sugar-binding transcriptional regulator [Amaricoccus sp.]|uniref:sugar-binding transcriptional regulator n=1 Tax=Amaricoccus sp. TaxID=1872485 RepID=UPI001B707367|nr:sugar-binding transcriptional regulator [Amaricoccus sp.]MBP7002881.1 sugar-binding transcriptional regulator [Amaricoccus sp.]